MGVRMRRDETIVPANSGRNTWSTLLASIAEEPGSEAAERKQDRSRRREQEIHRAAIRVFAREGIARARIADMAAEAGIPISSIYEYYPSKEELAYAVPADQLRKFFVEFGQRAADFKSARDMLAVYLRMSIDFARRNPEWARILYLEVWPSVIVKESRVRKGIDDFRPRRRPLNSRGRASRRMGGGPEPFRNRRHPDRQRQPAHHHLVALSPAARHHESCDSMIRRVMSLLPPAVADQAAFLTRV